MKEFGIKEIGADYQTRVGVHVVIPSVTHDEILLIQAPNGAYFLPGGEIEEGETHPETIKRELIEECGFECVIGKFLGEASDYYYSKHRTQHYYNPIYAYEALSYTVIGERTEKKSVPKWFPTDLAIQNLKRDSHKWAVEEWLKLQEN